jgi:lipopolysaccharide heptosyltransferase II
VTGDALWASALKILCVRLDSIGDVLMTTPAIRALKESRPHRRISLLTSPVGARIAPLVPEVDDVVTFEASWMKATPEGVTAAAEHDMIDRLRSLRFDAAVIFTVYSQNPLAAAHMCFLAGIPLRLAHCRENPYQLLTTWVKETEPSGVPRHEVLRQLDLVARVGCTTAESRLSLRIPGHAMNSVTRLLDALEIDRTRPLVVIHPGASAPSRRYPPKGFARAAETLARDLGVRVVFTGTGPERPLVESIRGLMNTGSVSLAGVLDLEEMAALLSLSSVLVCNNTGPAHMAAALGTPVVSLYALTNPQHTPWSVPSKVLYHDVDCKYCYKSICRRGHNDCLGLVPPDEVASATKDLLGEKWGAKRRTTQDTGIRREHVAGGAI